MDVEILARAYSEIGFPFYAIDLGDLATFLDHPRAHEGSHYWINIEGVLPERMPGVAVALGRIMQQVTVPPEYPQHFADSHLIKQKPGLAEKLLNLTSNPDPTYRMSVLPERLAWEEISPWPVAYSTFFGQLGELIRVYALLIRKRCQELAGVSILDHTSRVLPTRFHYAAGSLGAWGGGTLNLQFLSFLAVSPSLGDPAINESVAVSLGYELSTAKILTESGLIAISHEMAETIFEAQGDSSLFGGTFVDEFNSANPPNGAELFKAKRKDRDGYLLDKHYRSSFRAHDLGSQALYGARDVLRDHYAAFYKNLVFADLLRCKHYCVPMIDVSNPAELSAITNEIPIHSKEGIFFRGQTSLYPLSRHAKVKSMLFGDSTSLEPSLGTSAARSNFDYDQLHFALRYFIQDYVIRGASILEPFDEGRKRWQELSLSPLCELDYAIMALAQHYGLPSHGLDVTTSTDIAIWFATNVWSKAGNWATYRRKTEAEWGDDPVRWPVVFACQQVTHSLGMSLQKCRELSGFGLSAVRPDRQEASFFHGGHSDHQNRLAETVVCVFRLKPGSWRTHASYEQLFPPLEEDPAYAAMLQFASTAAYQPLGADKVARYSYAIA